MGVQIARAKDGKEKQNTYAKYMLQYNKAIRNEFYLEAIMIDYAMMEDRLVALLHYVGIVSRNQPKLCVNKFCRADIRKLLGYKEKAAIRINNISVKVKIFDVLMSLTGTGDSEFINDIVAHVDSSAGRGEIKDLCSAITEWCDTRNQYVHALLNKNYDALQEGLKDFAENGHGIARRIDACVKVIKVNNTIRKKFKIK